MVTVNPRIGSDLFLMMRDLLSAIQAEIDHSSAVLDEFYGTHTKLGLEQLGLSIRRIESNLETEVFLSNLPYVPERAGFSVDPNLLTLLVEPLYGKVPAVGIRELVQNSVDAVRELQVWCNSHAKPPAAVDMPKQEADVLVEFIEQDDQKWVLKITDKGIGMRSDTIQHYFLRAGASFRQSADWARECQDDEGKPLVIRAGRFGIGSFAVFLLGERFRLWTRHVTAESEAGYFIEVAKDSHRIEICKRDCLPVGTTVEIELSSENIANLIDGLKDEGSFRRKLTDTSDWYTLDSPIVRRRVVQKKGAFDLPQRITVQTNSPEWAVIHPEGFDAVFWSFLEGPNISCNGFLIGEPDDSPLPFKAFKFAEFAWPEARSFERPKIAVMDGEANLALTIQRYALSNKELPFIGELTEDVMRSVIAHALVCGPTAHAVLPKSAGQVNHPLSLLQWCSTTRAFVLSDPWLYSLLKNEKHCLVYGALTLTQPEETKGSIETITTKANVDHAFLRWNRVLKSDFLDIFGTLSGRKEDMTAEAASFLQDLCVRGVDSIDRSPIGARAVLSVARRSTLRYRRDERVKIGRLTSPKAGRYWYDFTSGNPTSSLPLEEFLTEIEAHCRRHGPPPKFLYVAEILNKISHSKPESPLAKTWDECLGPNAIPFEPTARERFIELARQNANLKRHIEAWEAMKRANSEWLRAESAASQRSQLDKLLGLT